MCGSQKILDTIIKFSSIQINSGNDNDTTMYITFSNPASGDIWYQCVQETPTEYFGFHTDSFSLQWFINIVPPLLQLDWLPLFLFFPSTLKIG